MADKTFPPGAAAQLSRRKFKGITLTEDAQVSVGTTVTEIAPSDPERVLVSFANAGIATVYMAPTNLVSSTRGFAIPPGGTLTLDIEGDAEMVTRRWYAIADAAAQTVFRAVERRTIALPEE